MYEYISEQIYKDESFDFDPEEDQEMKKIVERFQTQKNLKLIKKFTQSHPKEELFLDHLRRVSESIQHSRYQRAYDYNSIINQYNSSFGNYYDSDYSDNYEMSEDDQYFDSDEEYQHKSHRFTSSIKTKDELKNHLKNLEYSEKWKLNDIICQKLKEEYASKINRHVIIPSQLILRSSNLKQNLRRWIDWIWNVTPK